MAARRKPDISFTGVTLEQWQSDVNNLTWAQQEPRFRALVSVVLNESHLAHETVAGCSGERAFGRVEGYHLALNVLRSLTKKPMRQSPDLPETFDEPSQHIYKDKEPLD